MKRVYCIVGVCVLALLLGAGTGIADDYVEDVYYWDDASSRVSDGGLVPNYNTRAKEIIFIEDSTQTQHPDTVRAILREAL